MQPIGWLSVLLILILPIAASSGQNVKRGPTTTHSSTCRVVKQGPVSARRSICTSSSILAAQHFNSTGSSECKTGEDTTSPNVLATTVVGGNTDCDRTATPAPAEGAQYLYLPGGLSSVVYDNLFTDQTTGTTTISFDLQVITDLEVGADSFIGGVRVAGHTGWPIYYLDNAKDRFRLTCETGNDNYSADNTYTVGTWHEIRLEWYWTGGPGVCTGSLTNACTDCGCLFVDNVQVTQCEASAASSGIDGTGFSAAANAYNLAVDDFSICSGRPPFGCLE